jgi:hypothetical protein
MDGWVSVSLLLSFVQQVLDVVVWRLLLRLTLTAELFLWCRRMVGVEMDVGCFTCVLFFTLCFLSLCLGNGDWDGNIM